MRLLFIVQRTLARIAAAQCEAATGGEQVQAGAVKKKHADTLIKICRWFNSVPLPSAPAYSRIPAELANKKCSPAGSGTAFLV
jgi:hypothetical protein